MIENDSPDVCVVGAGPAGLAIALRMAAHGRQVTLVDAGGPGVDAVGADLHGGRVESSVDAADRSDDALVGGNLYPSDHLETTRWRHPGGSSWRWGASGRPSGPPTVRMVEAKASDFGPRPTFDIPGFPMGADEVLRYGPDALAFLGLEGHSFDPDDYDDGRSGAKLAPRFLDNLFHFPRADVLRRTRPDQAMADPLIDVRTGLHLRRIERTRERISRLSFVDADGSTTTLTPTTVVLSLGGVENSRHLLVGASEGSIPNKHDLIGRYFMDHPHVRLGYLHQADVSDCSYYDFQCIRDTFVLRGHGIDPDVAESEGLLRFSIDLVGRHELDGTTTGLALAQLKDGIERRDVKLAGRSALQALRHPIDAARLGKVAAGGAVHHTGLGGWSVADARLLPVGVVSVESMFEQRPSWDNRIRLDESETDRYGMARPTLQWSFSRGEITGIRRATEVTSDAFEEAGLGPLTTMPELGEGPIPRAGTGMHHLGGTRMHADPTQGVVDEHGRIHDLENIYVAGSSVFPTSVGFANPTFTILQMALRLADHLSDQPGPTRAAA